MTAVGQLDHHIWAVLPPPLWLPTRHNRQLHQALHTLDAYVYRQIAEHAVLSRPWTTCSQGFSRA